MALLRLAERLLLVKHSQGRNTCNEKIPPRAEQANVGPHCSSVALGTPPTANTADALQGADQDARSSIACNQSGAER